MYTAIASTPLAITVLINGRPELRGEISPTVLPRLADTIARNWAALSVRGRFAVVIRTAAGEAVVVGSGVVHADHLRHAMEATDE